METKKVEGVVDVSEDFFFKYDLNFLDKGEIHVWTASLENSVVFFEQCRASLTAQERERISFYQFEQDQKNYILSQGGLRLLLSLYLKINTAEVLIGRHSKGKPFSLNDASLFFNISNSGDRVVYAISRAGEVGIDLEQIRPLEDLDELIEKNFCDLEKRFICHQSDAKLFRFLKFWTVKESYLKAIGEGMRLTPDNLEFSVENNQFRLKEVKGFFEDKDWISSPILLTPEYVGTLTYIGEQTQILASREL